MLFHPDSDYRHAMRWYTRIGRRVWFHEVFDFLFKSRPRSTGPTLREFMGASLAEREYALAKPRKRQSNQPVTIRCARESPVPSRTS
jgi:anaerobic magnesium-protoporphyrin IX monomethyl ester cyclase